MHELSIAQSIISIVNQSIPHDQDGQIRKIFLQIGTLSGIEIDALTFAFEMLKEKTQLQNASLEIEMINAEATCNNCGHSFAYASFGTPCPNCGNYSIKIIRGREMRVTGIELD